MHVELVRTVTRDGLRLDGALADGVGSLFRPTRLENGNDSDRKKLPTPSALPSTGSRPTAALLLHGVAGNFYTSSTFEPLIAKLQVLGLEVLSVNTRGHDSVFGASLGTLRRRFGAAYETVDDCRHDIAGWIDFLASRGHQRIVLIGHSLGAIKAVYAQALEKFPQVAAVVAVSGPRLSYAAFMNSPESSVFFESFDTAQRMVADGRGDDLFTGKFPFPLLITASGYIDKYGPAERYNLLRYSADLPSPALFTYGSKELTHGGIAFAGLPEALMAQPNADQRQVAVIEGADHVYSGTADKLAEEVTTWLRQKYLVLSTEY